MTKDEPARRHILGARAKNQPLPLFSLLTFGFPMAYIRLLTPPFLRHPRGKLTVSLIPITSTPAHLLTCSTPQPLFPSPLRNIMRLKTKSLFRCFHFERLETRDLLAGNVNVAVNAGELDITGDAASNAIQVTQLASGQWKVTGIATKINGGNAAFTTTNANPVTGDIDISLGQGNNTLQMLNGNAPANVNIISGSGNDVLKLSNLTCNPSVGTISIDAGDGSNVATLTNITTGFEISITGGANADAIAVSNVDTLALEISAGNGTNVIALNNASTRDMHISGGANTDSVALNNVSSFKDLEVDLGDGTNALTLNHFSQSDSFSTTITAGNGRNSITLANVNLERSPDGGHLSIQTGDGPDAISLANVHLSGCPLSIIAGNGNDVIALASVAVVGGGVGIDTGGGTNAVSLNKVNVGSDDLSVDVGPGNYDSLAVVNCTAGTEEFSDTGGTNGTIVGALNHFATPPMVSGFKYEFGI